ncbi:Uncharacterized protein HZ326_0379 [Fusarium oxysporum f. sp. albedinis]|nr:Uncharacterized protein HZ326_0379 [Fusarium oxysporum f. sp. albedinis]
MTTTLLEGASVFRSLIHDERSHDNVQYYTLVMVNNDAKDGISSDGLFASLLFLIRSDKITSRGSAWGPGYSRR